MTQNPSEPFIQLRQAKVGYPGMVVLDKLDLKIDQGSFVILTGPNGAGKTTLLKSLGGILPLLAGKAVNPSLKVGYVPQQEKIDAAFPVTAREFVNIGAASSRSPWSCLALRHDPYDFECLRRCQADAFAQRLFSQLSGGQRQRVLLARALATRPNTLLLDEPTSGIDRDTQAILIELMGELRKSEGMTILVATHDADSFRNAATCRIYIEGGKLIWRSL